MIGGHAARMGGGYVHTEFWWRNLKAGDDLEDLGTDGRLILKWIFKKWDRAACTGLFWLRIVMSGVFFKAEIHLCVGRVA